MSLGMVVLVKSYILAMYFFMEGGDLAGWFTFKADERIKLGNVSTLD